MNERLKELRKHYRFTQAEMGAELGVSRDAIATYESGRVIPDKSIRLLICEKFNVNEAWLETGEGVAYKEGLVSELVNALRNMPAVQASLERLLPRLTPADLEHINDLVERLLEEK